MRSVRGGDRVAGIAADVSDQLRTVSRTAAAERCDVLNYSQSRVRSFRTMHGMCMGRGKYAPAPL